jgi:cytoskeletal protein CcmA (bactofilin family)
LAWKRHSDEKPRESDKDNWIGFMDEGVRLEGTLQLTGVFRLNGKAKGTIISEQSLILGEHAQVEGQIEGNHVAIAGRFDGVIFAKGRVEIQSKGVVTGEIHAPCLVIEPGGIFDGQCHMLAASESSKPLMIPIRSANQ